MKLSNQMAFGIEVYCLIRVGSAAAAAHRPPRQWHCSLQGYRFARHGSHGKRYFKYLFTNE